METNVVNINCLSIVMLLCIKQHVKQHLKLNSGVMKWNMGPKCINAIPRNWKKIIGKDG